MTGTKAPSQWKTKVSQEHACEEEVPLNNNIGKQIGDLIEMPSEAVKQEMDDHVPDEIDGAKCEQLPSMLLRKFPEVKGWLDEDLDNYHLKELRCSTQCHTQMSMWIISRGVVLLILLMLGISFKFDISGLLHHVITTIAYRIRDKDTSQSKQNLQSSSMTFIHKTLIIPSVLDSCFISSTVSEVKRYSTNMRRTDADFSHAPPNEYSPSPDDKKQWSLVWFDFYKIPLCTLMTSRRLLDQIDDLDEEMDINWQIAMTAIKIKKFYKKTGRRPRVDGKMHVAFDRENLDCSIATILAFCQVSNVSSIVFSICPSNDSDGELGAVSDANSTVYSTCQSNDSDGEQGMYLTIQSKMTLFLPLLAGYHCHQKTQPQELESKMEWNLEKKMARSCLREKGGSCDVRQATPAWTNTKQGEIKQIQFHSQMVNVNTGHGNVNSGTQIKSGSSRFNTGKLNVNSGSVHVNSARVTRPVSNQTSYKTSPKLSQGPILKNIKNFPKRDLLFGRSKVVSVEKLSLLEREEIDRDEEVSLMPDDDEMEIRFIIEANQFVFGFAHSGVLTLALSHLCALVESAFCMGPLHEVRIMSTTPARALRRPPLAPPPHCQTLRTRDDVVTPNSTLTHSAHPARSPSTLLYSPSISRASQTWVYGYPRESPLDLEHSAIVIWWFQLTGTPKRCGKLLWKVVMGSKAMWDLVSPHDTKIHMIMKATICIVKNPVYHFQDKITLRFVTLFIRDVNERAPHPSSDSSPITNINPDLCTTTFIASMLLVATTRLQDKNMCSSSIPQPSPPPTPYPTSTSPPPPIPSPTPPPIPSPTPTPIPTSTSPPPIIPSPTPPPTSLPPPPPETDPPTDEHINEEQSPVHHHFSPSQAQAPSYMPTDDLLQTVPKLISRIDSLELDLKQTKLTMGNAIVKLVKKVKKLEGFLKRRNLVLTDSEDEEPEVQGRKSQADPQDSSKQGLVTPPTTKAHASGEEQEEDISPNTLEAAKTLSNVASLKSRSIDKGRRYKRRKETKGKKVVSSLDFQEDNTGAEKINTAGEVNAASIEVNTASKVNTGSIELNTVIEQDSTAGENKGQREGKAPMLNWDLIRAKLEANTELSKSMLGSELQGEDFAKRMVDLNQWDKEDNSAEENWSLKKVKEEFDKLVKQIESFAPISFEATKASLKRFGEELQTKTPNRMKEENDDEQ
ncbi:hypothetical protein Tco_0168204 [Tanacetum coccineum]